MGDAAETLGVEHVSAPKQLELLRRGDLCRSRRGRWRVETFRAEVAHGLECGHWCRNREEGCGRERCRQCRWLRGGKLSDEERTGPGAEVRVQKLAPIVCEHLPAAFVYFDRRRVVAQKAQKSLLQVRHTQTRGDGAQNAARREMLADVRRKQRVDALGTRTSELQ